MGDKDEEGEDIKTREVDFLFQGQWMRAEVRREGEWKQEEKEMEGEAVQWEFREISLA